MLTGGFRFRLNARFLFDPIGLRLRDAFEEVRTVYKHLVRVLATIQGLLLFISMAHAQSAILDLPRASQRAVVTQRIGITDVSISYHRPLVNKRKIWGGVVPYGDVWRAGANENTTIAFTDPVNVEGKTLPKGTYGLHMIPGENEWTLIFSKNSTSWGSFTYDQKEDALRVAVKPQPADFHEALTYDFDDVKPDSSIVTLRWEKVAVPFKVAVNLNDVVQQSLNQQLRGLAQYTWFGWDDAATYLVDNKGNLDAMGRKDEANATKNKALAKANALQLHTYARQLQNEGKQNEAFTIFRDNAKKNPDQWIVHVGLSRMYSGQGDFANASKEMNTSISTAPDNQKPPLQAFAKRLQAKEDIN